MDLESEVPMYLTNTQNGRCMEATLFDAQYHPGSCQSIGIIGKDGDTSNGRSSVFSESDELITEGTEVTEMEFVVGLNGQVCLSTPVYMDGAFREATDQTENTDETEGTGLSSTGGSLLEWFLPSGFMSQRWDCPVCCTDSRQTRAVGVDLQCCQSKICRTCLEAIVSTKCKLCPQCGEQLCALDICAGMMSTQQWIEADTDNAEKNNGLGADSASKPMTGCGLQLQGTPTASSQEEVTEPNSVYVKRPPSYARGARACVRAWRGNFGGLRRMLGQCDPLYVVAATPSRLSDSANRMMSHFAMPPPPER